MRRTRAWFLRLLFLPSLPAVACGCQLGFPAFNGIDLVFNETVVASVVADETPCLEVAPIFDDIPGRMGHHAAAITAFPDGEMLAAWYSYTGPHELDGSAIFMSRRGPGDAAWEMPWQHIDRFVGDANPVLYSEGEEAWLFQAVVPFGWSTAHVEVQRSHDRGRSWQEPRVVQGPLGMNVRHPPVRTSEGDLLLPAYDDLFKRALFLASADGETWTLRSAVYTAAPDSSIQPSIAVADGVRLLAVMRNNGRGWLWVTASDDNGRSWSFPQDSGFANPDSSAKLLRLSDGVLVLVFNDSPSERRPLSVSLSADGGRRWSLPKTLADGDSTYDYPAAVQTSDGRIHVLYTQGRETIRHAAFNAAWVLTQP